MCPLLYTNTKYSDKVLFKNFIDINGVSLVERFKKYTPISDIQEKAIIERLSPEYAIILNEKENLPAKTIRRQDPDRTP